MAPSVLKDGRIVVIEERFPPEMKMDFDEEMHLRMYFTEPRYMIRESNGNYDLVEQKDIKHF